ncbi:uncharacterized protein CTRU02_212393 [Colletotrichum truncatum]|uniref:Uncharacterized protein n=1 Tax=Colletotrichum truncatum TaxID=5467 RepID=A0ACC3YNE8_COLTU|nr:uncharacterized protein CTRU02_08735 [Colletotrichum truncatum]KAF6789488.1 hypothetical protein CTRU02_08735 [Colletotrichum truncatum]
MSGRTNTNDGRVQKRKRPRPLPPHVNARNLAIEKRRRGEMNENFLDLARLVPPLASARKLTKVLIINESIQHFRAQRDMCIAAAADMQDLLAENRRLVSEINTMRSQFGGPLTEARPVTEPMAWLMSVKDEVYGTFPAGFGDNWAEGSSEDLQPGGGIADQDVSLPVDGFFTPGDQAYLARLSPPDEPNPLPNEVAVTMPASDYQQVPWGFMPYSDNSGQPPTMPLLDPFAASGVSFDNQVLGNITDSANTVTSSWVGGLDLSDTGSYLQQTTSQKEYPNS